MLVAIHRGSRTNSVAIFGQKLTMALASQLAVRIHACSSMQYSHTYMYMHTYSAIWSHDYNHNNDIIITGHVTILL